MAHGSWLSIIRMALSSKLQHSDSAPEFREHRAWIINDDCVFVCYVHHVRTLLTAPFVDLGEVRLELAPRKMGNIASPWRYGELGYHRTRRVLPWRRSRYAMGSARLQARVPELAHYVECSRKGVERNRLALKDIQRILTMYDDDISVLPRHLKDKRREDWIVMQQKAQRELKRYEDALSIATTVLGERRQ
jgi:hypothetical protein